MATKNGKSDLVQPTIAFYDEMDDASKNPGAGLGAEMFQNLFLWQNIVHIGALLFIVGFACRNQLYLRLFAILGDCCYIAYYAVAANTPLWSAMFWSFTGVSINLFMIALILRDSRISNLNDDELNLFRNLRGLSPGQFRRLMQIGKWTKATERERLTTEGETLDRLHYVLDGKVEIDKSGRQIFADPAVFIGELAFLRQKPATATVHISPQSLYVTWTHHELNKAMNKSDELRNAMAMLLNNDLAEKVARA